MLSFQKDYKLHNCITFFLLFGVFLIFSPTLQVRAQGVTDELSLSFVKDTDNITSSELHFNALKIVNNTQHIINGVVKFNLPEGWRLFSMNENKVKVNPLDTVFVPVRISPIYDALGNITYILNATFKTPEKLYSANTYLTIPEISMWNIESEKSSIYVSEENPGGSLIIKLSNKGNTNELIKLDYQPGKLIDFNNAANKDLITDYVNLAAYRDTTIVRPFVYNMKMNYLDRLRLENSWRESTVIITASTDDKKTIVSNIIRKLSSNFTNVRNQKSSPLNFDYNVYNIMSNQEVRNNINIYGNILLENNREIQYNTGLQNIYFSRALNNNFDINRQFIYNVRYTDKRNNIALGYNVYGGNLHSINGRGIIGSYAINKKNTLSYAVTQNPFTNSIGGNIGFNSTLKKVNINSEITYESNIYNSYNGASALIGAGFTLFKYHNFSIQALGSRATYHEAARDTSVLGFSYRLNYNVRYKNFDLRFSGMNSTNNYIQNAGLQQFYIDSRYVINDKIRIALYGTHHLYSTTRYPYNFDHPANYSSTDNLRLTAIIASNGITYQFGPNYVGTLRQQHNLINSFTTEYKTFQPGFWASASIKIDPTHSISPNLTISNMNFNYKTDNPALTSYSSNEGLYYSLGLNYNDNNWKINAYYTSGSVSDIYRSIEIYDTPKTSKSLQIRPVYENYFFNKRVKLSAFVNFAYYLPSERQNITYNVKYDHYLKNGWNLYLSGYMFSNTRNDEATGRVSTVDLNLIAGISKSFDIQQPRLKYYDVKAVFFNDLDGNRVKSENEPPVPNILVNVVKDKMVSNTQSNLPEIDLVSDKNGEILIDNLPRDTYKLTFSPLINLQSFYFLNGSTQNYYNEGSRVIFVPLVESYRIKGKIVLVRDPNSSEGRIDVDGIRITATGQNNEVYSVLTDKTGSFILNVPNGDKYNVKVNNVFGEQFTIDANEVQVQFTKNKTVNLDFTFTEKRREINFGNGNQLFKFNINNSQNNNQQE